MKRKCRASPRRAAAATRRRPTRRGRGGDQLRRAERLRPGRRFRSGTSTEYLPVSPIVGTVNLKDAKDSKAAASPIYRHQVAGSLALPQRSNVLITAGFTMRVRRTYPRLCGVQSRIRPSRPAGSSRPTARRSGPISTAGRRSRGWLDRRADPNSRNIYTYIPSGSGAGSMVAFTTANVALLTPHMGVGINTSTLISLVRSQPLGAVIGSTPALMDAPSLDPPPDDDYGRTDGTGTFAGDHKDRRSLIFVGMNDGMIHAIDAHRGTRSGRSFHSTCCRSCGH